MKIPLFDPKDDGRLYFQSVHISGGGSPRSQSQIQGGSQVSDFSGGVPGLRFFGEGSPRSQIFFGGGVPVSVKGKIFDTRFDLIHVQTGK